MKTTKKKGINEDNNFRCNGNAQKEEYMKKDHIFWSSGRMKIKEMNQ